MARRWNAAIVTASVAVFVVVSSPAWSSGPPRYELGGHLKSRAVARSFPDDSFYHDLTGASANDLAGNLRLNFAADTPGWNFRADAQFIALYGDSVELSRELEALVPGFALSPSRLPNDERRWWDLTHVSQDQGRTALLSRLDRLSVGYTGSSLSLRFGRQALSWGNGLFYSPMDIVNPFDPAQVDTEYKAGDDMLYGQLLMQNSNDIEGSYVFRRNLASGELDDDESTLAVKYHGFGGVTEYDLMLARHYGDAMAAIGGSFDSGGAVWRSDLVLSDTETDGIITQLVVNSSYSWTWADRNVTGSVEYYYNGFGQQDGCYSQSCLAENPALVERIARGQLFSLARNYLGGSVTVEVNPLFTLTPNLFWNLDDGSALAQLVAQNSLGDNLVLLGALSIPVGPDGTEFGGIESTDGDATFSSGVSLFLQLGWYF